MSYREITCQSACNHLSESRLPYRWDLNIYRGCAHGCKYCFALYSHRYMSGDYYDDIFVKCNVAERLEKQLKSRTWKGEVINIGGVTDSYQPAEKTYRLMPAILEVLIRYRNPMILSTKSTLILRDFALIDKLSQVAPVNIAATITTPHDEIAKQIEPGGAPIKERFAMLQAMRETNASTGLHIMPVIPYITDSYQDLLQLYHMGKESTVSYAITELLNLRGETRKVFFDFLETSMPAVYPKIVSLYQSKEAKGLYKKEFYRNMAQIRQETGVSPDYKRVMQPRQKQAGGMIQLSLFDED